MTSTTEASQRLDDQLCFALYAASRAVTSLYRPILDKLDLTYPQYLVLLVLWENGDSSVTAIGRTLSLDSGTLSPLLKRLERAGFVHRIRQQTDERSVLVSLTDKGAALRHDARAVPNTIAEAMALPDDTFTELRSTLRTLTTSVNTYRETHQR